MAIARRRPEAGLIHHSDQGSQFVSLAFGQACAKAGIARSMGSRGDCWDNAVAESFFATLKRELIHRQTWPTPRRAADRRLRVHRDLLQGHPKTLDARDALPDRIRDDQSLSSSRGLRAYLNRPLWRSSWRGRRVPF
jgi:transposase InsO family protein